MSGYDLARSLRQLLPKIRLIAISGWNREEDRKRSTEAGFDHHLAKPVELSTLLQLVSEDH